MSTRAMRTVDCPNCRGTGEVNTENGCCQACGGRGYLLAPPAPAAAPSEAEIEHARNMVNSHAWTLVNALRSRASEQDKRLFDALHDALTEQGRLEVAAAAARAQAEGGRT